MNLLMVRHGEIPANVNKVYAGRSSEKLTDKGILQVKDVAVRLRSCNIHALYSSPMKRAVQTAEIIGNTIGLELITEDAFREMGLGPWEGLSEKDVTETYPEEWQMWQRMPAELTLPGRETLNELLVRTLTGLQRIFPDMADKNIAIVTHVAVIRILTLWHEQKSLNLYKTIQVPNADIFKIKIYSRPSL
jgi:broad specificity phosphatase PhoE